MCLLHGKQSQHMLILKISGSSNEELLAILTNQHNKRKKINKLIWSTLLWSITTPQR